MFPKWIFLVLIVDDLDCTIMIKNAIVFNSEYKSKIKTGS